MLRKELPLGANRNDIEVERSKFLKPQNAHEGRWRLRLDDLPPKWMINRDPGLQYLEKHWSSASSPVSAAVSLRLRGHP